jgi:hypothetical protein
MGTAYFHTTGPASIFVRFPATGAGPFVSPTALKANATAPTFLGHCDKTPKPAFDQKWKPLYSSQTGEGEPADKAYMGTAVKVALPLQRFDWDVVQALMAAPRYGRGTSPGTETYYDVGSLLLRNGLAFEMWMRYEFAGSVNQTTGLPIGIYFPACNVAGTYPDNLTRDAAMMQLLIEANWVQLAPNGNRVCFTQDPSFFPAATATPG